MSYNDIAKADESTMVLEQMHINACLCLSFGKEAKDIINTLGIQNWLDSETGTHTLIDLDTLICDLCYLSGIDDIYFGSIIHNQPLKNEDKYNMPIMDDSFYSIDMNDVTRVHDAISNNDDSNDHYRSQRNRKWRGVYDLTYETDKSKSYERYTDLLYKIAKQIMLGTNNVEQNIITVLSDTLNGIILYGTIESDIALAYFCKLLMKEAFIKGKYCFNIYGIQWLQCMTDDIVNNNVRVYHYNWCGKIYALSFLAGLMSKIRTASRRVDRIHHGFTSCNLITALAAVKQYMKDRSIMDILKNKLA